MPSSISELRQEAGSELNTLWEKSDTVLWAFTSDGIVLHNFTQGICLELDATAHVVWSYLDGRHSTKDIAEKLCELPARGDSSPDGNSAFVIKVIGELLAGGFIRSRQ
ncbi:PqqD family protein [Sinorhizobium meliloti]|uniref:PqqD family protein n=1 Tax=Rhizobium meliloti TaxID=382 RepID=UPI0023808657|nr:PqqD family protein [Sinorhizobium meliloti]MDE3775449.1 PqqD family protein [Sinorhizobium meliloti]